MNGSCDRCDATGVDLEPVPVEVDADEDGVREVTEDLCPDCVEAAIAQWEADHPVDVYALHGVTRSDFV